MNEVQVFLSLSVIVPIAIAAIRSKSMPGSYYPLIILLIAGLVNEIICFFLFRKNNAIPTNIYFIIEFILFALLFRNWKNILRHTTAFRVMIYVMVAVWLAENMVLGKISQFHPVFTISYSLLLIFFAVNQISWIVVNDDSEVLKNDKFIICIAVIIFFSFKVLVEIFYFYAPSYEMKSNVFNIQAYLNVIYNIMLAIAILCIRPKSSFTQL